MNETQLLNLVNFCLQSKIPWATHALACLLEDFLDLTSIRTSSEIEGETESVPSTSWETTNGKQNRNIQNIYKYVLNAMFLYGIELRKFLSF